MKNQYYVVIFPNIYQDPSGTVLDLLQPLKTLSRDPDEKCIAVIELGRDKGMGQFSCIRKRVCETKLGNISEVEKGDLPEVFNMGVKSEIWIKSYAKVAD